MLRFEPHIRLYTSDWLTIEVNSIGNGMIFPLWIIVSLARSPVRGSRGKGKGTHWRNNFWEGHFFCEVKDARLDGTLEIDLASILAEIQLLL